MLFIAVVAKAQVGIGTTTPDSKAVLDVSSTTLGLLPPRMDSTQRNAIVSPPEGLVIYNTTIKSFQCYNGTSWYSTVHFIGENYGGGIVFFIYDNGQHGLIASLNNQSNGTTWYNGTYTYTGATGDGMNAGAMNTVQIEATQIAANPTGDFAAKVCRAYSVTVGGITYGDWYLPSKYELNLLYLKQNLVGGFSGLAYWSSSEVDNNYAWDQSFGNGSRYNGNKFFSNYVRAIRSF